VAGSGAFHLRKLKLLKVDKFALFKGRKTVEKMIGSTIGADLSLQFLDGIPI
jgi:hypothetical protein